MGEPSGGAGRHVGNALEHACDRARRCDRGRGRGGRAPCAHGARARGRAACCGRHRRRGDCKRVGRSRSGGGSGAAVSEARAARRAPPRGRGPPGTCDGKGSVFGDRWVTYLSGERSVPVFSGVAGGNFAKFKAKMVNFN